MGKETLERKKPRKPARKPVRGRKSKPAAASVRNTPPVEAVVVAEASASTDEPSDVAKTRAYIAKLAAESTVALEEQLRRRAAIKSIQALCAAGGMSSDEYSKQKQAELDLEEV